jgi:hypothetical protein
MRIGGQGNPRKREAVAARRREIDRLARAGERQASRNASDCLRGEPGTGKALPRGAQDFGETFLRAKADVARPGRALPKTRPLRFGQVRTAACPAAILPEKECFSFKCGAPGSHCLVRVNAAGPKIAARRFLCLTTGCANGH